MRMKKPLSMGFVALLMLSIATVMVPTSADTHPAQAIWVDPGSYLTAPELDTLKYCDTFTVDVMVNITDPPGPGLYGWDYHLKWNSTNINLTDYTINIPPEWGINWFKPKDELGHLPDCWAYHWLGVAALAPAPPVTGVRSLCTYNFHVIETIWEPDPDEIGTLDLYQTKLGDHMGDVILHTTHDGKYRKCAQPPIPGDVNRDGTVDIFDVVIIGSAYGSKPGHPRWNPQADLNNDDLIDIFDLVIIGINYGKTL